MKGSAPPGLKRTPMSSRLSAKVTTVAVCITPSLLRLRSVGHLVEPVEDDAQLSPHGRIGLDHDEAAVGARGPVAFLREVEGTVEQRLRCTERAGGGDGMMHR